MSGRDALTVFEFEPEPVGVGSGPVQALVRVALVAAPLEDRGMGPRDRTGLIRREEGLPQARPALPEVLVAARRSEVLQGVGRDRPGDGLRGGGVTERLA